VPNGLTSFVENGTQLQFDYQTAMLPDTDAMSENAMLETTVYMAVPPATSYTVYALNQDNAVLVQASTPPIGQPTIWGAFTWGGAPWGGPTNALFPRKVPWPRQIIFRRLSLRVIGVSAQQFKIGTTHMRYEQLGYMQQGQVA
jgi:hypothetical protein